MRYWPGRAKPGVAATGLFLEQSSEGRLPAGAEGRDAEGSEQLLAWVPWEVEQGIRISDRQLFGVRSKLDDLVSRLHLAQFEHAEVEARAMV